MNGSQEHGQDLISSRDGATVVEKTSGPHQVSGPTTTDYSTWSPSALIDRISALEARLRSQTQEISALLSSAQSNVSQSSDNVSPESTAQVPFRKPKPPPRPFDFSSHPTRYIALKLAYLGEDYNGFEHSNGTLTPLPTVEEVIWKALRKARLIDPPIGEGCDHSYDVVWGKKARAEKYGEPGPASSKGQNTLKLDISWEGCQYSKCGRTDRGVSAFGQVIGVKVRSRVRKPASETSESSTTNAEVDNADFNTDLDSASIVPRDSLKSTPVASNPIPELPYATLLNSLLPPTIRILAVCLDPPPTFSARFSCSERRYHYFFTDPAFAPGSSTDDVSDFPTTGIKEGYLDIELMRTAAQKLIGLHDFRNLCKVDASKPMTAGFDRRITFADIEEVPDPLGGDIWSSHGDKIEIRSATNGTDRSSSTSTEMALGPPKLYSFTVHGTAFLWHQVRCMVAILFLIGQRLEEPSLIEELFDVATNPCRPLYEMADDGPLVLWDCVFERDEARDRGEEVQLNWMYVGDHRSLEGLVYGVVQPKNKRDEPVRLKTDGKFGIGGLADETWALWRKAKMHEVLAGQLLGRVVRMGDNCPLIAATGENEDRGEPGTSGSLVKRGDSARVFDGSERSRLAGTYVPVMNRPRMDSVEVQKAKWESGKGMRRKEKVNEKGHTEGMNGV